MRGGKVVVSREVLGEINLYTDFLLLGPSSIVGELQLHLGQIHSIFPLFLRISFHFNLVIYLLHSFGW